METWNLLSYTMMIISAGSVLWLWVTNLKRLRTEFFFLFFYTTVVMYLQIAPVFAVGEYRNSALESLGVQDPALYFREYAIIQFFCWLFFQLPLLILYRGAKPKRTEQRQLMVLPAKAAFLAIGSIVFALASLGALMRNDLLYIRLGGPELASRLVNLPVLDYIVVRSYQESILFILGVLFFLSHYAFGQARLVSRIALGLNLLVYGLSGLLNSRWTVLSVLVVLVGWWLATRPPRFASVRHLAAVGLAGLVAIYLMIVVVNVRTVGFNGTIRPEYFNPFSTGVFGDTQGIGRLNCVDLMARLAPRVQAEGPAMGMAWQSSGWLIWRFFDPTGFDVFRLSLSTTSKSYLMSHYLGWEMADYFSCTLTDLFGNFSVFGFLLGAGIFGFLYAFCRWTLEFPKSGRMFVLGLFVLTHILVFDQEAATLLFGWSRELPILLLMLVANPFTTKPLSIPPAHAESA